MMINQRRKTAPVIHRHAVPPDRLRQHFLDKQRIDVHQADLQQMPFVILPGSRPRPMFARASILSPWE